MPPGPKPVNRRTALRSVGASSGRHPFRSVSDRLRRLRRLAHSGAAARRIAAAGLSLLVAALFHGTSVSQEPGFPFPEDERLSFSIDWPSGLSVGSAEFRARFVDPGWRFQTALRATLPEIEVNDAFVSRTDEALCSIEFEKHVRHGRKRAHESLRFGPGTVRRTNLEGNSADPPGMEPAGSCAQDALAYLYHLRRDLAAGRIPPPADVFFGARYRVTLRHAQTRRIVLHAERLLADEIRAVVRGPAAEHSFSIYFGRDEARTPLLFRVEVEGTPFTMQLAEETEEE